MQRGYVALGAVALEVAHPPGQVAPAAVLLDQLGDAVAPLAIALGAFDPEHGQLSLDGSYWLELRQSDAQSLVVSVPASEAAVLKYFQSRMPYGIVVPDDPS